MVNEQNQNVDKYDIPVWRKYTLSVQEAAKYFHIVYEIGFWHNQVVEIGPAQGSR